MMKRWTAVVGLALIITLSACGGKLERRAGEINANPDKAAQTQPVTAAPTLAVEEKLPTEGAVEPQMNMAEQSLSDLDQALGSTDTLNEAINLPTPDPQVDQNLTSIEQSLNALNNSLNSVDTMNDVK